MPKTKIPTLGAVAAEQDDEKKKGRIGRALGVLAAAFGLDAPSAKMTKKTLTTKRVEMEESDESEEEESVPPTTPAGSSAASSEMSSAGSSKEEEEEESGAASSAEEEEAARKGAKKMEEEEEARAVAKGWKAAIAAYAKATEGVDAYGIKGPKGLLRAAEKATGAKGAAATLTALHGLRSKAATADAAVIQRLAQVEAKATKIETQSRKDRVDAMVKAAKAEGRAPNADLRAQLRDYGNAHGTKKLAALIATLKPLPTNAKAPKLNAEGKPEGAPEANEQEILKAMFDDLPEAQRAQAIAMYEANKRKNLNGKAEV